MTYINSPSVLCIIIFLRLCFALLEEVPLTICEGGLHNPPCQNLTMKLHPKVIIVPGIHKVPKRKCLGEHLHCRVFNKSAHDENT